MNGRTIKMYFKVSCDIIFVVLSFQLFCEQIYRKEKYRCTNKLLVCMLQLKTGLRPKRRLKPSSVHSTVIYTSLVYFREKYRLSQEKFTRLQSHEIKSLWPIFVTKMLIYQSKANLDEKILFGKITHHLDPEIRKMWVMGTFGNRKPTFHSGL